MADWKHYTAGAAGVLALGAALYFGFKGADNVVNAITPERAYEKIILRTPHGDIPYEIEDKSLYTRVLGRAAEHRDRSLTGKEISGILLRTDNILSATEAADPTNSHNKQNRLITAELKKALDDKLLPRALSNASDF